MKKLFAILLIAALAVALVACGGNQNNDVQDDAVQDDAIIEEDPTLSAEALETIRTSYDKADAYITAALGDNDMEAQEQDDQDGESIYKSWFDEGEVADGVIKEDIEIAGNTITPGKTTVKDTEGFKNVTVEKSNATADPGMNTTVNFSDNNKYAYALTVNNEGSEAVAADDLLISEVTSGNGGEALDFTYDGLTLTSTLADILDKLGTAGCTINLSADEFRTTIEVSYFQSEQNGSEVTDSTLALTLTYDADSDTATVSGITLRKETYTAQENAE